MSSDNEILKIQKRFYPTEEIRLKKIQDNSIIIEKLSHIIEPYALNLYALKIKLHIFDICVNTLTMHAGLFPCCGKTLIPINNELYKKVSSDILKFTNYHIIWES